jgi:hypothetical protein
MTNRHIIDRALPERSKLRFYFPSLEYNGNYYVVTMPFFENIVIKESKKARYQKYSLISRSSNLYSYLGADSRQLNLSFNITLPHIQDDHPDITLDKYITYDNDKSNLDLERELFKNPHKLESPAKGLAWILGTAYTKGLAEESAKQVRNNLGIDEAPPEEEDVQAEEASSQIIDIIIYWTNIIRSSVTNYSKNPIYGPPIIRLRHGILYQDVPCICTNYSIEYNEQAGYDLKTLLPRQLKINMKLEEIRTGDFGEFKPDDESNPIKRDNLAGWEAVVLGSTHSMDPGSGGI